MRAYRTGQGNWQLNFSFDGKQRTLSLGRHCGRVSADRTAKIVSELLTVRKMGDSVPSDLLQRVGTFPARVRDSLCRSGLVPCCFGMSLGDLWEKYLASKSHLKKNSLVAYRDTRNLMVNHFGHDLSISSLSRSDAERFYSSLLRIYNVCTSSTTFRRCRAVFAFAVEQGFSSENPFSFDVRRVDVNESRWHYVSSETIREVLTFCRDDRERLAVVLGRFAGLRVPSELQPLRFKDFVKDVVRVPCDTKTGFREVPLVREIRDIFSRLVGTPDDLIFGGHCRNWFREFFLRAIERAGVDRWEKLWVNLRSSCITDFSRMGYDEKTMDSIFGNTARVRRVHYVQFDKQRAYSRVLADGDRIFSGGQDSAVIQELIPLLREFLFQQK
jgi:hypothetical protein